MASRDPHVSFAMRGVYHHSRGFALQLELPIDENVVTGVSLISRPATLCYELLGRSPSEGKFTGLRFSWLKTNFEHLPSTANEREVMQAARSYIMHLIGGVLMPDADDSMVHLMYLPLLSNLHNTRSYSWGSAVLAMLYRELYRTTDPSTIDIGDASYCRSRGHFTGCHSWHPLVINHIYFHSLIGDEFLLVIRIS
ncbi:hypothetical protein PVK06_012920 [Gossypium arboreum]|uniref:Aminotransferase-like plant mobile domain-containing protein n=1 Tax=Gossypium arboreum TaxID=29729 RepID=A0ABR0QD30_GOSAR|nr:hypothetical protein PVK06_012920 [Gossypium arboreum]